jgi:hypothetical protein
MRFTSQSVKTSENWNTRHSGRWNRTVLSNDADWSGGRVDHEPRNHPLSAHHRVQGGIGVIIARWSGRQEGVERLGACSRDVAKLRRTSYLPIGVVPLQLRYLHLVPGG